MAGKVRRFAFAAGAWFCLLASVPGTALGADGAGAAPALPAVAPGAPHPAAAAAQNASVPAVSSAGMPDINISWSGYFEALAILCLLLGGLWVFLWFVKRRGRRFFPSGGPDFQIESRVALGPRSWILVGKYANRRLLIGATEHHINLIAEYAIEEEERLEQTGAAEPGTPAPGGGREDAAAFRTFLQLTRSDHV